MKKITLTVLGFLSSLALSAGIFACAPPDNTNSSVNSVGGSENNSQNSESADDGDKPVLLPDLRFNINHDDSYAICLGLSLGVEKESITVPSTYEGVPVKKIASGAFENSTLKEVILSEGITQIQENAFRSCANLESLQLPKSLEEIGRFAFADCTQLKSLTLPNSLQDVSFTAFDGCQIEEFSAPTHLLSSIDRQFLQRLTITGGDTLTHSALSNCDNLVSVVFPDSLKTIGYGVLSNCDSLTSVHIPEGVTHIGEYAFGDCPNLKKLSFPNSLESWGGGIGSSGIEFTNHDNGTYLGNDQNPYLVLYRANFTNRFTIPSTTKIIMPSAFSGLYTLESIVIPDSVIHIGSAAFNGCKLLTEVTIPKNVRILGSNPFPSTPLMQAFVVDGENANFHTIDGVLFDRENTRLIGYPAGKTDAEYTVPDGIEKIDGNAFISNPHLEKVLLPQGLKEIGVCAFTSCKKLESISLPSSVTEIGNYAFSETNIKTISIPEGVTEIGWELFEDCARLEEVTLGNKVRTIGYGAFRRCTSLRQINLPDSLLYIGQNAFEDCSALTDVTLPKKVSLEENAFLHAGLTSVQFAASTTFTLKPNETGKTITLRSEEIVAEYLTDTYANYRWSPSTN